MFNYSIPDRSTFGRLLLGICLLGHRRHQLSRRTHHRRSGLANVGPKYQRMIDVFATLVLLFRRVGADLDAVRQGARNL